MAYTTQEAAARLHVNQSRVRALVASGGLSARRVGRQWLVDADSVDRQASLIKARAAGRPMATRTAWAVADLADGGSARWLTAADRFRLRQRLSAVKIAEVVQRWLTLRANRVSRYRVGIDDLDVVLTTEGVVRTGVSAAKAYHLGLGTAGSADAYVDGETAAMLVRDFFLIDSAAGNLTLRVVEREYHLASARTLGDKQVATRLIVGADLADDTDVRTRAVGLRLIETVLAEQRK